MTDIPRSYPLDGSPSFREQPMTNDEGLPCVTELDGDYYLTLAALLRKEARRIDGTQAPTDDMGLLDEAAAGLECAASWHPTSHSIR